MHPEIRAHMPADADEKTTLSTPEHLPLLVFAFGKHLSLVEVFVPRGNVEEGWTFIAMLV